ncbi:MAG: 2-hydroxychromene-2-carboxylate isomerase [Nevskiaceae bacterium]|nr:MAG: 2-hydroxychromene-2-carboxylate isomerase [Nevskiaceae bacterium]
MSAFNKSGQLYFFLDFISHNAWLAWHQVHALAARNDLVIEPVPVLFAGLLKAHGQVGPAEVPAKLKWMTWNVLRKARQHGIPLAPPHTHPFNPLLPLRVACCELPRTQRLDLIQRLFRAAWAEGRAISEPEVVAAVITEAGLNADLVLAEAQSEAVKARLRSNTEAAIAAGVFGVPTMIARGELFWGFDDLEHLENFLRGVDPLGDDREAYADWFAIRPSAQRTR